MSVRFDSVAIGIGGFPEDVSENYVSFQIIEDPLLIIDITLIFLIYLNIEVCLYNLQLSHLLVTNHAIRWDINDNSCRIKVCGDLLASSTSLSIKM